VSELAFGIQFQSSLETDVSIRSVIPEELSFPQVRISVRASRIDFDRSLVMTYRVRKVPCFEAYGTQRNFRNFALGSQSANTFKDVAGLPEFSAVPVNKARLYQQREFFR
jgi:hypothetical protein